MISTLTSDTPPKWGRVLGNLLYEALILTALLLVAGTVYQPLFNFFGQQIVLEWIYRVYLLAVLYGYFVWCWTRGGQTLPMKSWWIRVEYADGRPLDIKGASIRFAIASLLFIGVPALAYLAWRSRLPLKQALWAAVAWWALPFLWRLYDHDRRFLHDRLSHTRIVWLGKHRPNDAP